MGDESSASDLCEYTLKLDIWMEIFKWKKPTKIEYIYW